MTKAYIHDPDAILDYYIDWSAWLAGDPLTLSTWDTPDTAVSLSQEALLGGVTQVWVTGGLAGTVVPLTNHIVTGGGREEDRTLYLIVRHK